MGALSEIIQREVGRRTVPVANPSNTSIGTSAAEVLPNDPDRLAFTIVNLSANAVYVAPSPTVSTSVGIRLDANGGALTMTWREDFHLVGLQWFALAAAAGSTVYVLGTVARAGRGD